jgi:hypothetical protein
LRRLSRHRPDIRSAHPLAPPFRNFGEDKLYDNDFGQRLQDGLTTIHPDMPTFRFSRSDAEAAVNYLKSIQAPKKRSDRRRRMTDTKKPVVE